MFSRYVRGTYKRKYFYGAVIIEQIVNAHKDINLITHAVGGTREKNPGKKERSFQTDLLPNTRITLQAWENNVLIFWAHAWGKMFHFKSSSNFTNSVLCKLQLNNSTSNFDIKWEFREYIKVLSKLPKVFKAFCFVFYVNVKLAVFVCHIQN